MVRLSLFFLTSAFAFAQPLVFGLKGGVPLSDFLSTAASGTINYTTVPNRYIIGAGAELNLPFHLGIEVDALYRHLNYKASSILSGGAVLQSTATTSNAWEFPVLAKYRFRTPIVHPYVEAGIAFDTLQGLKQTILQHGAGVFSTSGTPSELQKSTTKGFVMGAGLDIHFLLIHIQPELRYTRWGTKHFQDVLANTTVLQSNQNQAEFLVGIMF